MEVKFKGNPIRLNGILLKKGDIFPDFKVKNTQLEDVTFKDTDGMRIFLTVPSIDTPVCDLEVARFNKELIHYPYVSCYTISMDLPFAQERWCGAKRVENVTVLSDYKEHSFALATGTYLQELGLLTRAVFVVDPQDKIIYLEYVSEVTEHPDYDAVLEEIKKQNN